MPFGGSPQDLRDLATRIRRWADEVDRDAQRVRSGHQVEWRSTAGAAFRERLGQKADETAKVADAMRDAAADLDHLAGTLESRQELLHHLLEQAGKTIEDVEAMVRDGVTDVLGGVRDLADEALEKLDELKDRASGVAHTLTGGLL